jgi:integrase
MSVYKRPGATTYSYDFRLRNSRFNGDTGATTKREAQSVEAGIKETARKRFAEEAESLSAGMTVETAIGRWWLEVGQFNAVRNQATVLSNLDWIKRHLGAKKLLRDITDNQVAALVAKRRGESRFGKEKLGLVSASTVNRTCTQLLREVMIRARDVWAAPIAKINFGQHLLKEPQERVREATAGEEEAIMQQLAPGYAEAVAFASLSGCRRMEILGLEWPHVDFFSRRFTVTGKGGKIRTIPMSSALYDLLWKEKDHHPVKVFTYVARRTLKPLKIVKGRRYPLTEPGLKTAMRRAVPDAGVTNFRFHDTRHTAATRALRASNLKVVQKLLGHSNIETTTKYAHAMDDDIRNALDAMSAAKSATTSATPPASGTSINLEKKENSGQ